jgi:hypothetical protein
MVAVAGSSRSPRATCGGSAVPGVMRSSPSLPYVLYASSEPFVARVWRQANLVRSRTTVSLREKDRTGHVPRVAHLIFGRIKRSGMCSAKVDVALQENLRSWFDFAPTGCSLPQSATIIT